MPWKVRRNGKNLRAQRWVSKLDGSVGDSEFFSRTSYVETVIALPKPRVLLSSIPLLQRLRLQGLRDGSSVSLRQCESPEKVAEPFGCLWDRVAERQERFAVPGSKPL